MRQVISLAFPATEWRLAPGGQELVDQMQRYGSRISDDFRAMLLQTLPHWQGLYDTKEVTVEFDLGPGDRVGFVNITSHGEHSEVQNRLQTLVREKGWTMKGDYQVSSPGCSKMNEKEQP